jgi:Do/DeqQ family serine protease
MKNTRALVLGAALAAAALAPSAIELTRDAAAGPALPADGDIADVAEKATASVVNISSNQLVSRATTSPLDGDPFFDEYFGGRPRGKDRYGQSLGSGVIVSAKGYVLTNNHVVANGKDIKVAFTDGRELEADLVGSDPKSDLAVLKLKGKLGTLRPVTIGDSSKMRLGDVVLAIGNPFGVGQTVTMGIVSAKGRGMGVAEYEDFIQTDAAINPGNSGGALINMRGELIGINTAILSRTGGYQGIGFAIPTNMAKPIMDSLISNGKVVRGYLGVSIQDVTAELADTLKLGAEHGVLIGGVVKGGPAAKAGLKTGDVVVRIGDRPTEKVSQLRNLVAASTVGSKVKVEYVRGGKHGTAEVLLSAQPTDDTVAESAPSGGDTGKLGLKVAPLDKKARTKYDVPADITSGVLVTGVAPGSTAADIGLQPGDVIVQLNRTPIKSAKQLDEAYRAAQGKLALLLYRDGSTVYVVISK